MSASHNIFPHTNQMSVHEHAMVTLEEIGVFRFCLTEDNNLIVPMGQLTSMIDGLEWYSQLKSRESQVDGVIIGASMKWWQRRMFLRLARRVKEAGHSLATVLLDQNAFRSPEK